MSCGSKVAEGTIRVVGILGADGEVLSETAYFPGCTPRDECPGTGDKEAVTLTETEMFYLLMERRSCEMKKLIESMGLVKDKVAADKAEK